MTQLIDGRYEVIQSLSEGGFGITFLAKDLRRPGQPRCVVKQLKPQREFSADGWKAARRLFDQEAETLERLGRHDQIPLLLAHLEENGNFYIVQDFIEGRTLRDELHAVKRLPENEVITLLRQGLTVLSYVHQQGVIHRDIKPENLIRRQDGMLCLIDFGIVKEFSAQQLGLMAQPQSRLMATTVSIGTEGHTPFEQIRGKPCPASDVYALGMVALEALTGRYPNDLDVDPNTLDVVWRKGVTVSDALANVLNNMVCGHYGRRYIDGREALEALETLIFQASPTVMTNPKAQKPQSESQPNTQRQQSATQDELSSERGMNYTYLRDLLKAGKWWHADQETYEVMIRSVGKKSGQRFTRDELLNFPCTDLRTIDRLWMKYSQGKFGFSVQKKIYVECGAKLDGQYPGDHIWNKFCERIGWRKDEYLIRYQHLKANPYASPAGEFPVAWRWGFWGWMGVVTYGGLCISSLSQRLEICKVDRTDVALRSSSLSQPSEPGEVKLTDMLEKRIFDFLGTVGSASLSRIEMELGLTRFEMICALKSMFDRGLIEKSQRGKISEYQVRKQYYS